MINTTKEKIENYYSTVKEYIDSERKKDAAINIRYIIEIIIENYMEQYIPEEIYIKTVEKINHLYDMKFIDEFTANTLHHLRKLANKGAHDDEESISIQELSKSVLPLRRLIDDFFVKIGDENEDEISSKSYMRVYDEKWVDISFQNARNEIDYYNILEILSCYSDNKEALVYIKKCNDKLNELEQIKRENEIVIEHIRHRNNTISSRVMFSNDQFYAVDIYGDIIAYNIKLNDLKTALAWKGVKYWTIAGESIFTVFYDGKVAMICNAKSKYIKNNKYGDWDDIDKIAVNNSYKDIVVYGITIDNRVRVMNEKKYGEYTNGYNDDFYYQVEEWYDIADIKCTDDCVYGIKKDGTVVSCGRYGVSDFSEWKDIIDIYPEENDSGVIGLLTDGTVVCDRIDDFLQGVSQWTNIVKISIGTFHVLGLKADGKVVSLKSNNVNANKNCCEVSSWSNIVNIWAGDNVSIGLRADGTVLSCGKDADKYRTRICFNIFNFQNEYNICKEMRQYYNSLLKLQNKIKELQEKRESKEKEINTLKGVLHTSKKKELLKNQTLIGNEIQKIENQIIDYESRIEQMEECLREMQLKYVEEGFY